MHTLASAFPLALTLPLVLGLAVAFANGLAMSAMLATISITLSLGDESIAFAFGVILALSNIQGKIVLLNLV